MRQELNVKICANPQQYLTTISYRRGSPSSRRQGMLQVREEFENSLEGRHTGLEMRPIWCFKSPSNPAQSENCPVHPGPLEVLLKKGQPIQSMAI